MLPTATRPVTADMGQTPQQVAMVTTCVTTKAISLEGQVACTSSSGNLFHVLTKILYTVYSSAATTPTDSNQGNLNYHCVTDNPIRRLQGPGTTGTADNHVGRAPATTPNRKNGHSHI